MAGNQWQNCAEDYWCELQWTAYRLSVIEERNPRNQQRDNKKAHSRRHPQQLVSLESSQFHYEINKSSNRSRCPPLSVARWTVWYRLVNEGTMATLKRIVSLQPREFIKNWSFTAANNPLIRHRQPRSFFQPEQPLTCLRMSLDIIMVAVGFSRL